ncbi:MAG: helix-turn-helix transcriptional regulator, partial [Halioglobus sp.]|nr:helix-turn-helix transcriptional regulator [Halioglobus sp.]
DALASALHLSRRTLQRRLRQQGTSYQSLLRDTRLALAHRYLCDEQRSVLEVAYLLGFSDPSTFSRAFKRWTGLAPAEYRRARLPFPAGGATA